MEVEKKHILVISQYFYPENFRINDICREWVKRGYKITVLTGIPNYPKGEFFDGYDKNSIGQFTWEGIDIIRIPILARHRGAKAIFMNYLSFVISGYKWVKETSICCDLVFTFEVSPMTQALIGCWYAKKHKIKHFLYVQDLWPENVISVTGIKNPIIITPIQWMVDYIYIKTDFIFVTSPSFIDSICNRKKRVSKNKVYYWPQYAEDFYKPVTEKKDKFNLSEQNMVNIAFTGNVGYAQGLDILPDTAVLLKDENIRFVIVGEGRYLEELKNLINKKNVEDKFKLISRQPAEEIPEILNNCQYAFLSFANEELWTRTIPAKLQSYMACAKPIIASAGGETKRIIEEAECGVCCEIGNAKELADGIREIIKMDQNKMANNSLRYCMENFNKQLLMNKMDEYIESVLG